MGEKEVLMDCCKECGISLQELQRDVPDDLLAETQLVTCLHCGVQVCTVFCSEPVEVEGEEETQAYLCNDCYVQALSVVLWGPHAKSCC
jgi:hypothetical protein